MSLRYLQRLIRNHAGIHIPKEKFSMIEIRLNPRLKALGLRSFKEYANYLIADPFGDELIEFTNALTTNKTVFFREKYHFDFLKSYLEKESPSDMTYLWSAACSSGEEAYSLSIICNLIAFSSPRFNYRILASDIDTNKIETAKKGIYKKNALSNVPKHLIRTYFSKIHEPFENKVIVSEKLKENIKFRAYNLTKKNNNIGISFNYIFLRNVLYYFSDDVVLKVLRSLIKQLNIGGLIFVSLTETLHHLDLGLLPIGSSVYRKIKHMNEKT